MNDFLMEIGIEEVPVFEINKISQQLKEKFKEKLAANSIEFDNIEAEATNKRFMIYIPNIKEKARDKEDKILGPAKKIAYDENGNPTLPLNKFIEFNNAKISDLKETDTKKGVYVYLMKIIKGRNTFDLLKILIPEILSEIKFSKPMLWNESRVGFVRPIKNILALFNNQLIDFQFAGINSSKVINGHILLSEDLLEINSYKEYIEVLNKNFVIVREDERKQIVLESLREVENELNAKIDIDQDMLDYYIYNNEYPVLFCGNFHKKYLKLPKEVIATFMINEKKLLPVYDKKNNLKNSFIGFSNIPDENQFVLKGNEKVIQATFEDAKFFWDNDLKNDFLLLRDRLKKVTFQKELGTYFDKTERLSILIEFLLNETKNEYLSEVLPEAAKHCKNDLVTKMVGEFPSLQGIMGGLYLKEAKADKNLWQSIYWHYEPKGFTSETLSHLGANILSIADKIDNIVGLISTGIKISGSRDPYGIRRDANAIIKIIIDFQLDFNLNKLIDQAAKKIIKDENKSKEAAEIIKRTFRGRIENIFKDNLNFHYDIVNAIMNQEELHLFRLYLRAHDLTKVVENESVQHLIIIHKRLKNIIGDTQKFEFKEKLLSENEEKILFEIFRESKEKIKVLIDEKKYIQACSEILEMKPVIDNFFDNILVMAKEQKIRENRLALLQKIDELISKIADFSLVMESRQISDN